MSIYQIWPVPENAANDYEKFVIPLPQELHFVELCGRRFYIHQ